MALLGEMLVERGAISVEQLHTGLAASRSGSDRLGTCLVDHGFIDESSLLEVLADQHGVPFVSQPMLLQFLDALNGGVLPKSMLQGLRVVPFRVEKDRIQVAMSNPGDARVIDRISNFTQRQVEPFVASDRTIEMAIDRAQSYEMPEPAEEDLLTEVVADEEATDSWEDLWTPRLDPDLLFQARSSPTAAGVVLVASYPSLVPVGSAEGKVRGMQTDARELARLLGNALTAGEIGETLMHYAAQRFDRVCLFAVHHGKISGWMSRGLPLDSEDIRSFSVFEDAPSIFWELEDRDRFVGPIAGSPVNDEIVKLLGVPEPSEVLVIPVPMAGHPKGYLLADNPVGGAVSQSVQTELEAAGRAAGEALAVVLRGRT